MRGPAYNARMIRGLERWTSPYRTDSTSLALSLSLLVCITRSRRLSLNLRAASLSCSPCSHVSCAALSALTRLSPMWECMCTYSQLHPALD